MRVLCAAALSLSLGLWVAFAEDKPPTDRAVRLAQMKKEFDETFKAMEDKFANAAQKDKKVIVTEMREETMLMAGRMVKVAEADPKDALAYDAASFVLKYAWRVDLTGPDVEKAVAVLAAHHFDNPNVKGLISPAMRLGSVGSKLIKAVSEKSADKEAKGTALFYRGVQAMQAVEDETDAAKGPALVKEAAALMEAAAKTAPTTKLGDGTPIEAAVKEQLEELKAVAAVVVGGKAPLTAAKALADDKPASMADYKGKVVLLNFWATWCKPCRALIPYEKRLVERMKDRPFALVGVSVDEEKKTVQDFLKNERLPWVQWWDAGEEGAIVKSYRAFSYPTLILIDHEGVIRYKFPVPDEKLIDAAVDELVKAAEKAKG